MSTVTKEIMNLARKAGYEGEDKTNVTKAIDALADTLAGENLEQATNVAAAIRKLQPYVGGGGGDGEVTSYTLENYNCIVIEMPRTATLQEDEVEAFVDEQIENWINGQPAPEGVSIMFDAQSNEITSNFYFLLDKNKNIIDIEIEPEAPAVGGGIVVAIGESLFPAMTFEKEGTEIPPGMPTMFHSPQQSGYYQQLYAIRTEYDDNDNLVPLEVVGKFDAEELIEDTIDVMIPGLGTLPHSLVNYPSLNSPLSLDDYIATGLSPDEIVQPRIVLCEIGIQFGK